jgi:hypothetical protein
MHFIASAGRITIREQTHPHTYTDRQLKDVQLLAAQGLFSLNFHPVPDAPKFEFAAADTNQRLYSRADLERLRLLATTGELVILFAPATRIPPPPTLTLELHQENPGEEEPDSIICDETLYGSGRPRMVTCEDIVEEAERQRLADDAESQPLTSAELKTVTDHLDAEREKERCKKTGEGESK